MALITTHRHSTADLEMWRVYEKIDALTAGRMGERLDEMATRAKVVMREFIEAGDGYLGISWGKDSLVCAHLLHQLQREGVHYPSVWVRVRHWENPDVPLVRDRFLERWPLDGYEEIEVDAGPDRVGGTSRRGFDEAARRHGRRHISGVRGDESAIRRLVMKRHGVDSIHTARPIGWWSTEAVFAYAHRHDLPLHPAYGYTMGGRFRRDRLRTASIGGDRGSSHGREGWERHYYPDVFEAAEEAGVR